MLLAIDVGNTNIVLGVFDGDRLAVSWRLATRRDQTADELGLLVDGVFGHSRVDRSTITAVVLSSVVPTLTGTVQAMAERDFGVKAVTVDASLDTGMPILYDQPSDVGADRLVNSIAAYEAWGRAAGRPMIVVD